jgi:signal transduction histidine kinase
LNIVQNAIDASPDGGIVTVSTGQLAGASESGGPWTTITVEDRGPGIPIALQKRLFEHFYTTKPGGTGLGLTLSKQIMMMHNGDIRVESEPRCGTKVTLLFPPTPDERGRH